MLQAHLPHDEGRPAEPDSFALLNASTLPLASSLTSGGRIRLARRIAFITHVRMGHSIPLSLRHSGLNITERSARFLLRDYQSHGLEALIDRRFLPQVVGRNPRRARTPEVEAIVLRLAVQGAMRTSALIRRCQEECDAARLPVPGATTVRRMLSAFRSPQRLLPPAALQTAAPAAAIHFCLSEA